MAPPRNLPNLITGSRLVLAAVLVVVFSAVEQGQEGEGPLARLGASEARLLLNAALAIFLTAAVTDILDGYIARRWGLTTDFGRIVDPFADKVIVCGTFVQLVPIEGSQVSSWMVVVILARELLVDGLRGFAESRGVAFPAMASGKAKMFTQSTCLGWILFSLANAEAVGWAAWAPTLTLVLLWAAVLITLYSGGVYVVHARKVLGSSSLAGATDAER